MKGLIRGIRRQEKRGQGMVAKAALRPKCGKEKQYRDPKARYEASVKALKNHTHVKA